MPSRRHRSQAGLTLIELMVVVAIVGIVTAIAVVKLNPDVDIGMIAGDISGAVGEASRKAVAAGPVDSAVIAYEGFTARSRLIIDNEGDNQFFAIELRREQGDNTSSWVEVSRTYLPHSIRVAGVEAGVARTEPGEGTPAAIPSGGFAVECESSGQCQAATVYLHTTGSQERRNRVVVMPLAAAPLVLADW